MTRKKILQSLLGLILAFPVAAFDIQGKWVEGRLLIGKAAPGSVAKFEGKLIPIGEDGLFIVGLHRDEPPTVTLEIVDSAGNTLTGVYQVTDGEYNIQKIEGIAKHIMQPSEADLKRATQENIAISKSRKNISKRQDFLNDFIIPVDGATTGVYGSQRVYNGVPGRPHYGWDIAAPTGTPVKAPNSGLVIFAQENTFYSGGLVIIDHGYHLSSSFLHLHKIHVKVGEEVAKSQIIGEVGATGRVTGPHLDWRMNWGKRRIDPQKLIDF